MKKTIAIILAAFMIITIGACTKKDTVAEEVIPEPLPEDVVETENTVTEEAVEPGANLTITLSTDKESYSLDDVIEVLITVINEGDKDAGMLLGSTTQEVPEAIKLDFAGLAPFAPSAVAANIGVGSIPAGESKTYTIKVAPYQGPNAPVDSDISFFKDNGDYKAGEGKYTLTAEIEWVTVEEDISKLLVNYDSMLKNSATATSTILIEK